MADSNAVENTTDLDELINLDRLVQFGRGTILPIEDTVVSLTGAVSGLSNELDGLENNIAPTEVSPAESDHAVGSYLFYNGNYYQVTNAIEIGDTLIEDTNIEQTTVSDQLGKGGGGLIVVAIPSVSVGTYTYNGTAQGPTIAGVDTAHVVVSGDQSATDAGEYTVTFSLANTSEMVWADLTSAPKTYTYTIGKATPTLTLDKSSVSLTSSSNYADIVATYNGDGAVSASSADTSVATVSLRTGTTFRITAVANGSTTVTISATEGNNYLAASKTVSVSCALTKVYGVSWDGTSTTAWTRTDSAAGFTDPVPAVNNGNGSSPFDSCMPWSGMTRENRAGGVMVKIPKYYYKWTRSGNTLKLQIADGPLSGYYVSPAHADRGDGKGQRDYVYVGAYHCTSDYKSKTGVAPLANKTRAEFRSGIHNLGTNIWQYDFAMYWTIMMLYLVEYADWNSQAKIGYGCGNNSGVENNGLTDGMTYHTGTNAANRTTYGHIRYRWIEGLWDNVYDWCDGIYFSSANVYAIKNPSNFSDTSGGTKIGTRPTSSNYISKWSNPTASGFEYALYPSEVNGSESTYVCDACYYNASGVVLCVGGYYVQSQFFGAFCLGGGNAASSKNAGVGSRIQELP